MIIFLKDLARTSLLQVARVGDVDAVRLLLGNPDPADVDIVDYSGNFALVDAIRNNELIAVHTLVAAGARLEALGIGSIDPVFAALECDNLSILQCLLDAGANLNIVRFALWDGDTRRTTVAPTTALIRCVELHQEATFRGLIRAGATIDLDAVPQQVVGWSALAAAAEQSQLSLLQALLDLGADVNLVLQRPPLGEGQDAFNLTGDVVTYRMDEPQTAIVAAAASGSLDAVKLLLAAGALVDPPSVECFPALSAAAAHGHVDVVRWLLDVGASVNPAGSLAPRRTPTSPLYWAVYHGHADVVSILLDRGAVHSVVINGRSMLETAMVMGHVHIFRLLLDADGGTQRDASHTRLLHVAADGGRYNFLCELIDAGLSVNGLNEHLLTPLHVAASSAVIRRLLQAGADPNTLNMSSRSPLAMVSRFYREETPCAQVISLIAGGAHLYHPANYVSAWLRRG